MESAGDNKPNSGSNTETNITKVEGPYRKKLTTFFKSDKWRWILGIIYIILVASIWIVASFIVQSVVDSGVSPFLITYICNSLFTIYIPLVEISRYFEDSIAKFTSSFISQQKNDLSEDLENVNLLQGNDNCRARDDSRAERNKEQIGGNGESSEIEIRANKEDLGLDKKGRWTRTRVAKVSLLICPFWFLAQLTFNLSLKYTTVTSNTILSSSSSLFTFIVALIFLNEKFTFLKLSSVLLCMAGTIIVSLSDSRSSADSVAKNPLLGDILTLVSAGLYAVYITLIRKKLPDEKEGKGEASMAQFLGFLGGFNAVIFAPVVLVLHFAGIEPVHVLTWQQVGLIVGKGLLDNVLSDYLWAKAIHLTTTTVATAGLTIQVPIAAIADSAMGHAPHLLDIVGAFAVLLGFVGINVNFGGKSEKSEEGIGGSGGEGERLGEEVL